MIKYRLKIMPLWDITEEKMMKPSPQESLNFELQRIFYDFACKQQRVETIKSRK
jgi:hypothetical protein